MSHRKVGERLHCSSPQLSGPFLKFFRCSNDFNIMQKVYEYLFLTVNVS
jgi:hypothetical protein